MGEKGYGGATTQAERSERTAYALDMIAAGGTVVGVGPAICKKFGCNQKTARRYVKAAKLLLAVDMPTVVVASRAHLRMLLAAMIRQSQDPKTVLAAIKQVRELLGLDAPARSEVAMTGEAFDPLAAYAGDRELMERSLQLERDIYDKALDPGNAGAVDVSGVGLPATPPGAGSVHDAPAVGPEHESGGCPDSGSPR